MKTKIIIVDDHTVFRASLIAYLQNYPEMELVGESVDGTDILNILSTLKPNIILMDIALPSGNGIDIGRQIKANYPEIKILILSMHLNPNFIFDALKAGFEGYVTKMSDIEEVTKAIKTIADGGEYYSKDVSQYAMQSYQNYHSKNNPADKPQYNLTNREREIIKHIVNGLNYREIAETLNISQYTVINHRQNIIQKLGLKSNAELIKFAIIQKIT